MKNAIAAAVLTLASLSVSAESLNYSQLRADFPDNPEAQEFVFKCVFNGTSQVMCTEMWNQFGSTYTEFESEAEQMEAAAEAQAAASIERALVKAEDKRTREEVAQERLSKMSQTEKLAYVDSNLTPDFGQLARMGMWVAVDPMILGHMVNGDSW